MLVLSRKEGEKIVIGEAIELLVVEIENDRVKLGVKAPHEIPVHREEVYRRIHESNGPTVPAVTD